MLGGLCLPPVRSVKIGEDSASLRSMLEPAPLRQGVTARDAWQRFSSPSWEKPLTADLRRDLEGAIREDIASVL